MQSDLIKKIVSSVIEKDGEKIVTALYGKKNVNEFLISKKLNLTINQTRNILYKLSDKGLVQFIRKKDNKKGGWYIYFWTLNTKKSLELLKHQIIEKLKKMDEEMKKRSNERYYYSPGSGIEYTEEEALEHNFICPETGEVMELRENKSLVDSIDVDSSKLKIILEEVNQEIDVIDKKLEKDKIKRLQTEAKEKEKERKARKEKMKRLRMKEAKAKEKPKKESIKKVKEKVKKNLTKKPNKNKKKRK